MPITKAERLEDIYMAFQPEPLATRSELDEFYVSDFSDTRGRNKIDHLAIGLNRQFGRVCYKAFVMGNPGVGISTELARLAAQVSRKFRTWRFSANTDLEPVNFKAFDVILRVALGLAEETAKPVEQGGAGSPLPDDLTRKLLDWFAVEKSTLKITQDTSAGASVGVGAPAASPWLALIGLAGSLKLETKRAYGRTKEVTEYREKNIGQLADLANAVLDDCNSRLRAASGHEWLVIGDDFDKPGIPDERIKELFLTYGNLLRDLRCHLILDLPVGLGHSSRSNQLPALFDGPHNFPDTPVFEANHQPHSQGRAALRAVIEKRMDPGLFADSQADRLIVASGGNLRDLFGLIVEAGTLAELRQSGPRQITAPDVGRAVNDLRRKYRDHLGEHDFDLEKIKLEDKLQKLSAIYCGQPTANVRDPVLYSLLHARAVQEFNGTGWFGVHPLIVDFLGTLKDIPELESHRNPSTRHLPGGTL
jgi:hypothetical protein